MTSGGLIDDTGEETKKQNKNKTKTEADKHTERYMSIHSYRERRREGNHPSAAQLDEYSPAVPTYLHT